MPAFCSGLTFFERFSTFPGPVAPSDEGKQKELLCGCLALSSSFPGWGERAGGLWGQGE